MSPIVLSVLVVWGLTALTALAVCRAAARGTAR